MSSRSKKKFISYLIKAIILGGIGVYGYIYTLGQMRLEDPFGVTLHGGFVGDYLFELFFWFIICFIFACCFIHFAFANVNAAIFQLEHKELVVTEILQKYNNSITVKASDGLVYNLSGFYSKDRKKSCWSRNVLDWRFYPVTLKYAGGYDRKLLEMLPTEAQKVMTRCMCQK